MTYSDMGGGNKTQYLENIEEINKDDKDDL